MEMPQSRSPHRMVAAVPLYFEAQMRVSILIVTFNSREVIKECIESLLSQTHKDVEILLYDNASSDDTVEIIKSSYGNRVRIVEGRYNRGFGYGLNRLAEIASGEVLASLNPDTITDKEWISSAISHFEQSDVGMVAPKILFRDRPDTIDSTGHLIYPDGLNRGRGHNKKDGSAFSSPNEVAFPSGSAGFYRRDLYLKLGGIDESLFLFGDDTDIGLKFQLSGYRCIYEPSSIVYHNYSSSTGRYSDLKAYFVERNRIHILLKYFPAHLIPLSIFHTIKRFLFHNYSAISGRGNTAEYLKEGSVFRLYTLMLIAYSDVLLDIKDVMKKRNEIKKTIDKNRIGRLLREFRISAREITLTE